MVSDALGEKVGLRGREKALEVLTVVVRSSRRWRQRRGFQYYPRTVSTVDGAEIGFNVVLYFKMKKHI